MNQINTQGYMPLVSGNGLLMTMTDLIEQGSFPCRDFLI